jgi:DNA-3-methyladenine glycosylase
MFNVVTGPLGRAEAVLIRALAPMDGLPPKLDIANGPGKVTRALGLSRRQNGIDLLRNKNLHIERGPRLADKKVCQGPRIGVDFAGAWARKPLRFWLATHPSVSRRR